MRRKLININPDNYNYHRGLCAALGVDMDTVDASTDVTAIVDAALERWSIEQSFHDLKEVERISEVQLRRYDANVGATNASLWYHMVVEVWSWTRPAATLA